MAALRSRLCLLWATSTPVRRLNASSRATRSATPLLAVSQLDLRLGRDSGATCAASSLFCCASRRFCTVSSVRGYSQSATARLTSSARRASAVLDVLAMRVGRLTLQRRCRCSGRLRRSQRTNSRGRSASGSLSPLARARRSLTATTMLGRPSSSTRTMSRSCS